ncbi:MAG: XylR N-terminal domain-containing protein [Candidatus Aenigmatarchaeota archaeon]|nr:MAG: XylR N-terminal domain-containing protein [Candidatus Aenigmarchaeota archaeon]
MMGIGTIFKKFLLARQIEMEKGRISIVGIRSANTSTSTLISIQEEVIKTLGDEGAKLLYNAGKVGGVELAKTMGKVMGLSGLKMAESLATGCTQMMGWGIVSVIKCDLKACTASFKVEDSPLSLKRYKKAFCHVERGQIAGAMEIIFNHKVDAIEIRCKSLGHHFCQFEIKPTEEFDSNDKLVREQLPADDIIKAKKKRPK